MARLIALLTLAVLAGLSSPRAQELPASLSAPRWERVASVVDGDTVLLEGGGEVRFVGVQTPKLPLGRANFSTWPLAPEAKSAVEALLLGREAGLTFAEGGTARGPLWPRPGAPGDARGRLGPGPPPGA